jgi:TatD DNase family protein
MSIPEPGDFIDIHVHNGNPAEGNFILESLMAHEEKLPERIHGVAYTFGIHPWFLDENNHINQLKAVEETVTNPDIIAIGEAGFDKVRGPSPDLQRKVFELQVGISEKVGKPLIIHCVKAWDELLAVKKIWKPSMPWMIHGFRGNLQLARQLLSKGMYLSVWFEYVLRPESADLLRSLPHDRFFLETDGADVDIRDIYKKVANDTDIAVEELKIRMRENFFKFFNL